MPMLVIMNTVSTFIMFNISQKAIHIETKINFLISLKLKGSFLLLTEIVTLFLLWYRSVLTEKNSCD